VCGEYSLHLPLFTAPLLCGSSWGWRGKGWKGSTGRARGSPVLGLLGSTGRRGWESGAPRCQVPWIGVGKELQLLHHLWEDLQSLMVYKVPPTPIPPGSADSHTQNRGSRTPLPSQQGAEPQRSTGSVSLGVGLWVWGTPAPLMLPSPNPYPPLQTLALRCLSPCHPEDK